MNQEFHNRLSMLFDDAEEGTAEEEKSPPEHCEQTIIQHSEGRPSGTTPKICKRKVSDEELGCCSFRRRRLIVEANPFLAEFFRRFYEKTKLGIRSKIFNWNRK